MEWYVIYVRSRNERKIAEILSERGIINYVPMFRSIRNWKDRRKLVETIAINGYVFVLMNRTKRLEVLQIDNVLGFVKSNNIDAVIPEYQIDAMRNILGQNEYVVEFDTSYLTPGVPVIIIDGVLTGIKGELMKLKGKDKVVVRLEHIKTNMLVELPTALIALADDYVSIESDVKCLKESLDIMEDSLLQ